MKFFRLDSVFYLIMILISLIPLCLFSPGNLSIYNLSISDTNSVSLWRGDGGASGYFDFKPVEKTDKLIKYTFTPKGEAPYSLNSSPILYKGVLYIGFKNRVVAFDLNEMKEKWNMKVSITPKTSFTVVDHYLFFPSWKSIIGVDIESKEVVFEYKFKREVVRTPINYKDEVIYFGTQYFFWHGFQSNEPFHVVMNGFDLKEKKFLFRYKVINQRKISYPVIDGKTLIFTTNNSVIALDLKTGRKKWRKNSSDFYLSDFAWVKGGSCYYYETGMNSSILHAVDVETGKEVFTHNFKTQLTSAFCIDDKNIYLSTMNGTLYSLNRFNGSINWMKENYKIVDGSLMIVRNILYFVKENSLFALEKGSGELLWKRDDRIEEPIFSPLASDGIIVIPHFFEIYIYKDIQRIPFLSFSFYDERDKNSVFLNYWDVENGKVYLNEKRLYIGYRRGVNTDILPYFWEGKGNMYLNCLLKKKDKSIIPIVSNVSSYSQERFYSFSDEKEVFYVDLKDDVLKIYKQENEDVVLTKTFQISHLLPRDILPGQKPLPLFLFKEDNKMWILIDYLSKNTIYENTLTEKFFIYRIEGDSIKFIKIKGIDNFSLNFLVSEEVFKKIAKDNKYIYIPLCLKDMCGRVCKINLDTGEVSFLNSKEENLPSISFVGIYNDFLIIYTRYEIFALKDGRIVGKILISKDGKNLTVYKEGRITQRKEIKNPYPDIMFPNINSP